MEPTPVSSSALNPQDFEIRKSDNSFALDRKSYTRVIYRPTNKMLLEFIGDKKVVVCYSVLNGDKIAIERYSTILWSRTQPDKIKEEVLRLVATFLICPYCHKNWGPICNICADEKADEVVRTYLQLKRGFR